MPSTSAMSSWTLGLAAAAVLLTSCSKGAGLSAEAGEDDEAQSIGRITVAATDAPLDYDLVEDALLTFDRIEIHQDDDGLGDDEGWQTLYDGEPFDIHISELRNGITQDLIDEDLAVGTYDQLRLHAVAGSLKLINENLYTVEAGTLRLGSLGTSGLKLHFDPPIEVVGGLTTSLLLDFDLSKMFKPIPANEPLEATRFNIHPSIRVVNLSETGDIVGIVQEDDGTGTLIGVDMASVYLMSPGETDVDNALTSTATEIDGHFALLGVAPGTYDIIAGLGNLSGTVVGVLVFLGNSTEVEVLID